MRSVWVLALLSLPPMAAPRRMMRSRRTAGEGPTAWSVATASMHGVPEGPLRTALAQAAKWSAGADSLDPPGLTFHMDMECAELEGLGVGLTSDTRGDAVTLQDPGMSRRACYQFCSGHRTLYFGVSQGNLCACFDTFASRAASAGCTTPCLGNASETCGGAAAYDVGLNALWQKERDGSSCGAPPAVGHANKTCADFGGQQPGGRCGVVCQEGYHLEDNTLICNSQTGRWLGRARCREVRCTMLPRLRHASSWCFGASAAEDGGACEVTCMPGYRLTSNTLKCNAHLRGQPSASSIGFFTGEAHCAPVGCGKLEAMQFGRVIHKEVFYPETVVQHCMAGFTHNGLPSGRAEFVTQCQQDGTFTPLGPTDRCRPVKCGAPPDIGNATVVSGDGTLPEELHFPESVMYRCEEGFSTDGSFHGVEPFVVGCQADGQLDDAPKCRPMSCGPPPQLPLAVAEGPGEARGYGEEVQYRCQEGTALSRLGPGDVNFSVRCNADGSFGGARECVRISCGPAPNVTEALVAGHEVFSGDAAEYVCEEGYTVSGSLAGDRTFHAECMPNGSFSKPVGCKPVQCQSPPLLINANLIPESLSLFAKGVHYLDVLAYQCQGGRVGRARTPRRSMGEA
ncbi:unnamed protein product [Prorocentrum cordatum]|uniref:Uncharacterized protein n=1 Tax=Prorocentrum cordatum TaxID=2364126 RepID=A0ABN9W146_9DINO|nr:unnamed protein product [Polarella glacialis]